MPHGEDLRIFFARLYPLCNELVHMGEVVSDEKSSSDIVMEGLTDECIQTKYYAERDPEYRLQ